MKKFFASIACVAFLTVGLTTQAIAQTPTPAEGAEPTTEAVTDSVAPVVDEIVEDEIAADQLPAEEASFHQALKTKFIEGGPEFMSAVLLVLVIGLAICLERIIYLNLADTNNDKLLQDIDAALDRGDVEGAKDIARNARGPVASIAYQGLMRVDQGIDVVERSIVSYGGVQSGLLEKNLSWITLFIAMAPSLGFLGTVVGMVMAFDKIERVGDISPTVVAGGMKVALITTIGGLIVALILQVFYNYILSKVEGILNKMEDASITILDSVIKYNVKYKK